MSLMPLLLNLTRTKRSSQPAKDASSRLLFQLANLASQPRKHLNTTLMQTSKLPFQLTEPVCRNPSTFRVTSGKGGLTCPLCQPRRHQSQITLRHLQNGTCQFQLSGARRWEIEPLHKVKHTLVLSNFRLTRFRFSYLRTKWIW